MKKCLYLILTILFSCQIPIKHSVTGVIKEIDINKNRLLIDHDEIPGFMDKMVMYFNLHKSIDINNFNSSTSLCLKKLTDNLTPDSRRILEKPSFLAFNKTSSKFRLLLIYITTI